MRHWLAILLGGMLALAVPAGPAMAEDAATPRTYPESTTTRARPDKPADIAARETAAADRAEAGCKAGNLAACTALGNAYRWGEGRPQNRPVAELILRKSCNAAEPDGCLALGELIMSARTEADEIEAARLIARACRLGTLDACEVEAGMLAAGTTGPADPVGAQALRRTACAAGNASACRSLASTLMEPDRSAADQAEGIALIDRLCRAGERMACNDAVMHWRAVEGSGGPRTRDYNGLACAAGDAGSCAALGRLELAIGGSGREAAQVLYDRACTLAPYMCSDAAALRDEPALTARCDMADQAACTALGQIMAQTGSPVENRSRALALLGAACEAGTAAVCLAAADLVYDDWRQTAIPQPARAEAYLQLSCESGNREACERLADELASGERLEQDTLRAGRLYLEQCDNGRSAACRFVQELALHDPAAPLALANAAYQPELTPDEAAAKARRDAEAEARDKAEERLRKCTTTTVVHDGVSYTDTLCDSIQRVLRGFAAAPGTAPWQALLWRPQMLGTIRLTPAQQVLCGGSLISEGWILTAAHCLIDEGLPIASAGHRVRLGLGNPLADEGFSYPILRAIPHPDYDRDVLAFDIALVQYDPRRGTRAGTATAPARVRLDPLPLEQRKLETLGPVMTFGWGVTRVGTGLIPDHLRGARLQLRDRASCTDQTKFKDSKRRDSIMCADDTRGARGGQACNGDSGGPLVSYGDIDRVPTVIGVVSSGKACGTADKPSRYIRVAHPRVRKWLAQYLPMPAPR